MRSELLAIEDAGMPLPMLRGIAAQAALNRTGSAPTAAPGIR